MKLFFGGINDSSWIVRALAGLSLDSEDSEKYFLTSFWGMNKKNWAQMYYNQNKEIEWIMDSGLFSMMFGSGKSQSYDYESIETYAHNYLDFVNVMKYKGTIVELDIHKILDINAVFKLRKIVEDEWDIERTIFVWHIEESIKGLIELANSKPYIAISIPELREISHMNKIKTQKLLYSLLHTIQEKCREYPKIHLLGCTQEDLMLNDKYYSVDSLSWMSGVRYGHSKVFQNGELISVPISSIIFKRLQDKHKAQLVITLMQYCKQYGFEMTSSRSILYSIHAALELFSYHQWGKYINWRYY